MGGKAGEHQDVQYLQANKHSAPLRYKSMQFPHNFLQGFVVVWETDYGICSGGLITEIAKTTQKTKKVACFFLTLYAAMGIKSTVVAGKRRVISGAAREASKHKGAHSEVQWLGLDCACTIRYRKNTSTID